MNNEPQLDSLLKQMAEDHQPGLPSPSLIWWRAQILKKQEQKERIERPIIVMRLVAAVVSLAVFAALGTAYWQEFQPLLGREIWLLLPLAIAVLTVSLVSASLLWATKGR